MMIMRLSSFLTFVFVALAGLGSTDATRIWPGAQQPISTVTLHCEAGPCMVCTHEDTSKPCVETGHRQVLDCTRRPEQGKTYLETLSLPLPEGYLILKSSGGPSAHMDMTLARGCTPAAGNDRSKASSQQLAAGQAAAVVVHAAGSTAAAQSAGHVQPAASGSQHESSVAAAAQQQARQMRELVEQADDAADGEDNMDKPIPDRDVVISEEIDEEMFSRHVTGESRRENDEDGMAGEEQHTEEEVIHAQHTAHGHVTGLDHTHWSLFHFELGMLAILAASLPVVYWRKRTIRHL